MKNNLVLTALLLVSGYALGEPLVQVLPDGKRSPASVNGPVRVWTETRKQPRRIVVHFMKIDLMNPKIDAFVMPSVDPDGPEGPAEGKLTMPDTLMNDASIIALINANAFSGVPSIPNPKRKRGWFLGRAVNMEGLVVADGVVRSPDQADRMPFWIDEDGKPHLGHPKPEDKVLHAVSDWFSPLLIDGKSAVGENPNGNGKLDEDDRKDTSIDMALHPRSMLGFDDTGKWLLLAVVDGRRKGYSIGMSLDEQAELMKSKGCTQAINMDGGGSSIMMIHNEAGKAITINRPSGSSHRPVPVMLGVRIQPKYDKANK